MITFSIYMDLIFISFLLTVSIILGIMKSELASRWADDESLVKEAVKADITSNNSQDPFKERAQKSQRTEINQGGETNNSQPNLNSNEYQNVNVEGEGVEEEEEENFHPIPKNKLSKETQRLFPVESAETSLAETFDESPGKKESISKESKKSASKEDTFLPSRWADVPKKPKKLQQEQLVTPPPSSESHRRESRSSNTKKGSKETRERFSSRRRHNAQKDTDEGAESSWGGSGTTLADMIRNSVPKNEKAKSDESKNGRKREKEQPEGRYEGGHTSRRHDTNGQSRRKQFDGDLEKRVDNHREKGATSRRERSRRNNGGRKVSFGDELPKEDKRHTRRGGHQTGGAFFRPPSKQSQKKKPEKKMSQEQINEEFDALKEEFSANTNWADDDFRI